MDNLHLFEMINASPALSSARLALATAIAQWSPWLAGAALAAIGLRGDARSRAELAQMLGAAALALALALLVDRLWPQPRPHMLLLGHQHMTQAGGLGFPSGRVTAVWALALSALGTTRFAVACFPLLALGLLVGLSRVYLGANFPYDVLAALPVAAAGALGERALRAAALRGLRRASRLYDRAMLAARSRLHRQR